MSAENADQLVSDIGQDYQLAKIDEKERVLLDYAALLTSKPHGVQADDIQRLRDQGWDDRAIHDACSIVAYFAFANRIANGLGIDLEPID